MDAVAPTTDGKNSSARHVPKSLTSVIGGGEEKSLYPLARPLPYQRKGRGIRALRCWGPDDGGVKLLGAVDAQHDHLLDVGGAARARDEGHPMRPDGFGARRAPHPSQGRHPRRHAPPPDV